MVRSTLGGSFMPGVWSGAFYNFPVHAPRTFLRGSVVKTFLKRFIANEDGGSLITFTVALPLIVGMLGVTVEASYWVKSKKDLQLTADMSAYAGAMELVDLENEQAVILATLDAMVNGYEVERGNITVNSPPTSGAFQGADAVEVVIRQKGEQYFSDLIGGDGINYTVRSVAAVLGDESVCILALNETVSRAFELSGSSVTSVNECSVAVNSSHNTGARIGGNAELEMECLQVVGNLYVGNSSTVTPQCDAMITGANLVDDPYGDLEAPNLATYPSSCSTPVKISNSEWAMSPGRYCSNMSFNTLVRMQPGTYIIDGKDLKLYGGGAHLIGDGVSIILMNGGSLTSLNGGAEIDIKAPLTGPYKGVAIYGDRDTQPSNLTIKLNGNSDSSIEGLIYLPNQDIQYGGNTSGVSDCTILVADEILLNGNAEFKTTTCKTDYALEIPGNLRVAVVE